MKTLLNISILSAMALGTACSSGGNGDGKVDIGDRYVSVVGEKLSDFAGDWDGYAEAYQFDSSGSDRIRITLDAEGHGTVRFGDMAAPATPTDPFVAYPSIDYGRLEGTGTAVPLNETPGFAYPVHALSLSDKRLRFEVSSTDLMDPFCAVVPSYPTQNTPSEYSPFGGVYVSQNPADESCVYENPSTNATDPVDCSAATPVSLAMIMCACRESACAATTTHAQASRFDGTLESSGTEFVATLALPANQNPNRITVRLTRPGE